MTAASALADALTDHFVDPKDPTSGVVLREVTAPASQRRIDLLAISLWSSRGYGIDAVEIKVDRADFLREIENPAKAEPWWKCSNRFWIAAPSTAVADPNVLPPGWGLLIPGKGRRFKVVVKAAERQLEVGMPLFAAILGRHVNDSANQYRRRLADYRDQADRDRQEELRQLHEKFAAEGDPEVRHALKLIREVEEASGLKIRNWGWKDQCSAEEFGKAVRVALDNVRVVAEVERHMDLTKIAADMYKIAQTLTTAAATLENGSAHV
jgi:hypothetical protein